VAAVVAVAVRLVAIVWDLWWRDGGGSVMHVKVYWMFRVSDSGVLRGNIMYARSYLCSDTQLPVSNVGLVHVHFQGKILSMWCVRLHCHTLNAKTDVKNMYPQSITCFDALFHLSRAIRESPSFTKQSSGQSLQNITLLPHVMSIHHNSHFSEQGCMPVPVGGMVGYQSDDPPMWCIQLAVLSQTNVSSPVASGAKHPVILSSVLRGMLQFAAY
jgi:hypothetical protein